MLKLPHGIIVDILTYEPVAKLNLERANENYNINCRRLLVATKPLHSASPSGHKRPLATHMRGAVLAFPDQDRSHTCSVRDRPTQLCIDRKAGRPEPRE
uniref:Uncharacterized protein n=1 Tax=Populus trichocarpa TaxID=3694 RepID=A0A2K2C6S4_POPTR